MASKRNAKFYEENSELVLDMSSLDLEDLDVREIDEQNLFSLPCTLPTSRISKLTQLILDHNDLRELPPEVTQMKHLKKLSVIGNQLCSLPEDLGSLQSLVELNIDENDVEAFPLSMATLNMLEVLSAIANRINRLNEKICFGLTSIKKLYLDENQLDQLPPSFGEMRSLEWFECSENILESVPESLGNLLKLEVLNLDTNKLYSLPNSFGSLPSLKVLLLSSNNISSLPASMKSAQILEKLYLEKNNMSELPSWMDELTSIKVLTVDDNELLNKPFGADFCKSALALQSLSAGRNYISELPQNIGLLQNLTVLHFGSTMKELERSNFQSGNWISSIPDSLVSLVHLKKLHLDENQIRKLPTEIGNLQSLEWLDLGQNQLENLPNSICDLQRLTYLQLSKNKLVSLPENLGNLTALIELRMDSNQLTRIPLSLVNIRGLQALDLFNNLLTEFPAALLSLRNLKRLDLDHNNFSIDDIPRILPTNCYPERDQALKDNWRGKTRPDKIRLKVIEISAADDKEATLSDEEAVPFNASALRAAMKAGMSLWRGHNDSRERQSNGSDSHPLWTESQWNEIPSNDVTAEIPQAKSDFIVETQEEDWDEELLNEYYQDTIDVCNSRKDRNSELIDPFQNTINRYPPCVFAFSRTACYDSLVYKKFSKSPTERTVYVLEDEDQFADADD